MMANADKDKEKDNGGSGRPLDADLRRDQRKK
jgi:hypothetical protein